MKIRFLKDNGIHKKGDVINLDATIASRLIQNNIAEKDVKKSVAKTKDVKKSNIKTK